SGWDDHPVLRIPRHRAGTVCSLEISNAVPGAVIHVGYSAGPGPVSTALGLVHLSPPIQLLPPIWVGANGAGVRQARIPHALRGIDAYLHALERAPSGGLRLSQPLWIVVQ
ncbi:MAG: hypothetical protein ISR76_06515, partial [Planctomycetes bacterium]|nr:hypothetical protein [Planctomycetota bacterium]